MIDSLSAPDATVQPDAQPAPAFWVRDVAVYGDVVLAPMAGFSDLPYRSLCKLYGSAMSYTEFVAADALVQGGNRRTRQMLAYTPHERPIVFQIFGNSEDKLVEAAQRIEALEPDIIDINMGCSVDRVSGRGAGAGLLLHPDKIGRIFRRLSRALSVPVTGKIRLGWNLEQLTYREVVQAMQENGASLVAVHARTKEQGYSGAANWDAIAEIVEAVSIPVLGNGDVRSREEIAAMRSHTRCAGVMVGRGAIGHPWIFQRRNREEIPFGEKALFIRRHFELMCTFYGDWLALLMVRKHIVRYLKGYAGIKDLHYALVTVASVADFHRLLDETLARLDPDALPAGAAEGAPADFPHIE